ncbi:uncharacterized protein An02g09380 [Aspergillus niger]|uniref:Contig An02c0290, genomic contig n=2 Tax=Aspergillus niger TaxID=5061 RepID=A2QE49_ASPNC|nr:uncharacterized protein An02g09380 [Aspergillus niger]CAK44341.1 unnamed protein product [Aspergillus niger]
MRNKQDASRTGVGGYRRLEIEGDHIRVSGDNDMHIVPCIVDQWMLLDSLLVSGFSPTGALPRFDVDHFALLLSNSSSILTACMVCTLGMAPSLVVWVSG